GERGELGEPRQGTDPVGADVVPSEVERGEVLERSQSPGALEPDVVAAEVEAREPGQARQSLGSLVSDPSEWIVGEAQGGEVLEGRERLGALVLDEVPCEIEAVETGEARERSGALVPEQVAREIERDEALEGRQSCECPSPGVPDRRSGRGASRLEDSDDPKRSQAHDRRNVARPFEGNAADHEDAILRPSLAYHALCASWLDQRQLRPSLRARPSQHLQESGIGEHREATAIADRRRGF